MAQDTRQVQPEYVSSYMIWAAAEEETNRAYYEHVALVVELVKLREPAGEFALMGWTADQIFARIAEVEAELASRPDPVYQVVPWPNPGPFPELH